MTHQQIKPDGAHFALGDTYAEDRQRLCRKASLAHLLKKGDITFAIERIKNYIGRGGLQL